MESPATRDSLLVRLRDGGDAEAWRQFLRLYAPVVYGFARKRGLQDADAADLMQDVLRSVVAAAPRLEYDPNRGSFRGWLFTVTRNKILNFFTSRRHRTDGSGDSDAYQRLQELPAPRRQRWRLGPGVRTALVGPGDGAGSPGVSGSHLARLLDDRRRSRRAPGMPARPWACRPVPSTSAKSRVLARLKEEVRRLQEERGD